MMDRCSRRNKTFKANYWHPTKLKYEARTRYLNWACRYLQPGQWKHFEISNQATDWPAVDAYFSSLFRRLHNQLNRQRRR